MPKKEIKHSPKFLEDKLLIEMQLQANKERHKMKMEEFKFLRESDAKHHENEMTRQRIKSAEIRKAQERREWGSFGQKHGKEKNT